MLKGSSVLATVKENSADTFVIAPFYIFHFFSAQPKKQFIIAITDDRPKIYR